MKKLMILLITCLFFVAGKGQKSNQQTLKNTFKQKIPWKPYEPREITMNQFLENKQEFGLSENSELKKISVSTNKKGTQHNKFTQTVCNVPVEGSMIITREKGNELMYNGVFVPNLDLNTKPTFTESEALQIAISSMNIITPSWENQAYEDLLKSIKNDATATNYPKGELVIYDNNYSKKAENYRLAYKFKIFLIEPLSNKTVYVDAHNGLILGSIENIHNCTETCNSKAATGITNYYGTKDFEVCMEDETYYLQHDKGGGISVYSSEGKRDFGQNCITSADNSFEENPTANEVYWAIHQYCDYLFNKFNRKSIDDNNHALVAFVNYSKDYNNAHWNGSFSVFGDGDSRLFSALTSLDIVAHEFTHGLIDYTAQLIYKNESGALNESFADIFGVLLEYYAFGETDWLIGNDFTLRHNSLRNFVNPKGPGQSSGPYPNTYQGDHWVPKNGKDYGGVHYNSSLQNHWFYLLCEGGNGVNDNGYEYAIEGIGIEKAAQITYENLINLFPTAEFIDAREGAMQAAKDIFGDDSFEAEQTKLAWCAVGVGECAPIDINCRLTDSLALIALYNSTDGANWTIPWDLNKPMDTWYGIVLNENGCVTCIDLDGDPDCSWRGDTGNNLIGTIPAELGDLKSLSRLRLKDNELEGSIPPELGTLTNLTMLNFTRNELTGNIPSELGDLINLTELSLGANNLTGIIPPELGKLHLLEFLTLSYNNLSGNIPTELKNLINLELLHLNDNDLTGSIPTDLKNLINLNNLALNDNDLIGSIPAELGQLSELNQLRLQDNNLSGSIPPTFSNLINLTVFRVNNNNLSGCYDSQLHELLCTILPASEYFEGNRDISDDNNFDATWEEFCATGAGECAPEICDPAKQREILIKFYLAAGGPNWTIKWDTLQPVSTWYGLEFDENGCVTCIDLDGDPDCEWRSDTGNNLIGTIPAEIGGLKSLTHLSLGDNELSGNIPPEIGKLTNLTELILTRNELTGNIPSELGDLINLTHLYLGANKLTGIIPPELGNLNSLQTLYLSYNDLIGIIPPELGNCILLKNLNLAFNELSGSIPVELSNLSDLNYLALSNNQLSGVIPSELGQLSNLLQLRLQNNNLSGSIPPTFNNLNELTVFRVNNNNLSGCYDSQLHELLCIILPASEYFDGNRDVSDDNNFDTTWEEFCTTGAGTCNNTFVLPGDSNNDGCLSYTDVLVWGLAYENTGIERPDATTAWIPQPAPDWVSDINGINGKHQDANGDGIVDIQDLGVFTQNFDIETARCNAEGSNVEREYTDHMLIKEAGTKELNNNLEVTFEIYVDSKLENVGLNMHGFEFVIDISGYENILSTRLDASSFNAKVDTLSALMEKDGGYQYQAAITRSDRGNSKFDRDSPAAIVIVIIEDLPTGTAIELKPRGSYITAAAGAIPLPLQGTTVHSVTNGDINTTTNVIPPGNTTKGKIEVFIETPYGSQDFTFEQSASITSCGENFYTEIDEEQCAITIFNACGNIVEVSNLEECFTNVPTPSISLPLHPNPAVDKVHFNLAFVDFCEQSVNSLAIYDMMGFLVKTIQPNRKGDCLYEVDVKHLTPGIYFIEAWSGDRKFNGKFIKQ